MYQIRGQLGYTYKSFGPFCAPEGWHRFTYTSDANPEETNFTITDSYGLIKAEGAVERSEPEPHPPLGRG